MCLAEYFPPFFCSFVFFVSLRVRGSSILLVVSTDKMVFNQSVFYGGG